MNNKTFLNNLLDQKLLLPPLSRYTDYPFRCILSNFNPSCICTEMVNARAIIEGNQKTMKLIKKEPGYHLKGVQLVGNNPEEMKIAAGIIEQKGFDYIDINMGCSVKKVVSKGQGVALMKQENLAETIIKKICSFVHIPITAKIRSGFSETHKNAVSLAKRLERAGISAITVHGRSGQIKFGKHVDYNIIQEVVKAVDIPVIANGGIHESNSIDILKMTGASAVMPGRSLIGNPWLINQIRQSISHFSYISPSLDEKKEVINHHATLQCKFYGECTGIRRFRTILPKYFRNCKNLVTLKNEIRKMESYSDVIWLLQRISFDNHEIFH